MRKLQILLILCCLAFAGSAQVSSSYTFSSTTNTYNTTLTGATTIFPAGWSSLVSNVPLPFTFYFNGKAYSSIWVSSNGYITFGATAPYASTNNPLANNNGFDGSVSAFGLCNPGASSGLMDPNANAVTYGTQTSGSNTVFVIQWSTAWRTSTYGNRVYNGIAYADAINFQIRLIQNTNVVEIMYGNCASNIAYNYSNLFSPVVGLGGASSADFNDLSKTATDTWTTSNITAGTSSSSYVDFSPITTTALINSGFTFDWTPVYTPSAFTGTPPVTTAVTNAGVTCGAVTLSLAGLPFNTGFTYQWQKSATGLAGSWTNCSGTGNTNSSYTETPTAATYYQCLVTGGSATTASSSVAVGRQSACPALPTYSYSEWYWTDFYGVGLNITSVSINGGACGTVLSDLDPSSSGYGQKTSTAASAGQDNYIDRTYLPPIKMYAGGTYSGTITDGGTNSMNGKVYIDFNDDGTFSAAEQVSSIAAILNTSSNNMSIVIPALGTSYYGLHRMRVRAAYGVTVASATGNIAGYGMTKDYMVSILPPDQTITPSLASPLCLPVTQEVYTAATNISTGTAPGTAYTYTWTGPTAFTTTAISSSNTMSFTPTTTAYSGIYSVVATVDGAQACNTPTYNLVVASSASAPTAGPTALSITNVNYQGATINFTPNATAPVGYLIVATNSATAPTAPVSGTTYATGLTGAFGANSIVISGSVYGSAPSYTTTALSSNSQYYIYIYAFNTSCAGPQYNTATPALSGNSIITCVAPVTSLAATAPTGSTINLAWTASVGGGNTAQYVSPSAFTYTIDAYLDATQTIEASGYPVTVTTNTYVASGLGVGTAYYFTVTSGAPGICGTKSTTVTNTTTCTGTASVPYIQNFETGSTYATISPNCWTGNAGQITTSTPRIGGEYKNGGGVGSPFSPHSGNWYYLFVGNNYISSATYANQWLVSPGFALSPGTYTFSFWYTSNSPWSTVKAEYSTTGTLPSNSASDMIGGTVIGTPPTNFSSPGWSHYVNTVTITTAGTYYFGIDGVMGTAATNLEMAIDDIEICSAPNAIASNTGAYCAPSTASLSSAGTTGALQYAWTGPNFYSATTASATVPTITTPGVYTYTLTATADPVSAGFSGACVSTVTTAVTVKGLPTSIVPTATPNPVCVGGAITLNGGVTGGNSLIYSWSGATTGITNAAVANATIPSAVPANAGNYTLTTTVSGCSGSLSGTTATPLAVNSLPTAVAPATSPNPVCVGGNFNLTGNVTGGSGLSYLWTGPTTGITSTTTVNTNISSAVAANAGAYTLTVTAPGCTGSVSGNTNAAPQVVNSLPSSVGPTVSPNPVCVGNTITLTGNVTDGAGLVYAWTGPTTGITGASAVNASITSAVPANAGTYTLTVTAPGCPGQVRGTTNSTPLVVNSLPTSVAPTASPNPVCVNSTITLTGNVTGGSGLSYSWTGPVTGITSASSVNTTINSAALTNAGSYSLTVTAAGCSSGVTTVIATPEVVNQLPSAVTASVSPNPACVGGTITLTGGNTGGSGVAYAWTGPSTGHISSANTESASITTAALTDAGTYTLTATATGCTGSTVGNSSALTINQLPAVVTASVTPNPACVGSAVTLTGGNTGGTGVAYAWSGPLNDITSASSENASITSAVAGDAGTYTLTATAAGCTGNTFGTSSALVIHQLPTAVTASVTPNPACVGGTVTLTGGNTGGSGVTYAWSGPLGDITSPSSESASITSAVAGDAGIYTLTATAAGCAGSTVASSDALVVNQVPSAVTASVSPNPACVGGTVTLTGGNTGGSGVTYAWSGPLGDIASASSENASITSAVAGDAGTYTLTATAAGCAGSVSNTSGALVVNTPPASVAPVTAPNPICVGFPITLTGNVTGGTNLTYAWSGPTAGIVNATAENTTITHASMANNGTYTLTVTAAGCAAVTGNTGANQQVVNSLPTIHTFTGGGGYCAGGTGVPVGLTLSDTGVSYQLYMTGGGAVGSPVTGTGAAISFDTTLTTPGVYYAVATGIHTTCTSTLSGITVFINPLPDTFTVIGGGSYCAAGSGADVMLTGSVSGISYQLYNGAAATGAPIAGTGSALDFGMQMTGGVYTAMATNTITGCMIAMAGTATVTVTPLPDVFTVTGGGAYCANDTGEHVGLSNSVSGVNYQLYLGSSTVGTAVAGTGAALDFGLQTAGGIYSVIATDATTTCVQAMDNTVTITVNPLPDVYDVQGGGAYCTGGTGVHINLSNSSSAVSYQLYNGTTAAGSATTGVDGALDFGLFTDAGSYTAIATNSTTGCTDTMNGAVTVSINPIVTPTVKIVTGTGTGDTVCNGFSVTFTAQTQFGGTTPNYRWRVNNVTVLTGDNDSTYTYIPAAGDEITMRMTSNAACTSVDPVRDTMDIQLLNPIAPSVFIVVTPITTNVQGTTVTLTAVTSDVVGTPLYQWYKNGALIPGATTNVYSNNNFNDHDSLTCEVVTTGACGGIVTFNSVVLTVIATDVKQVAAGNVNVQLIPNPNKGMFTIKGSLGTTADEEATIEITDMLGQTVYHGKTIVKGGTIDQQLQLSSTLANGMYMLNLVSKTSHTVFHFVIEQ